MAADKEYMMRLTKRQLKRIIREEYSRLKRRGLIKEMIEIPAAPASAFAMACDDKGIPCEQSGMSGLFNKVYACCKGQRPVSPAQCAMQLSPEEQMMFESDFLNVLVSCEICGTF